MQKKIVRKKMFPNALSRNFKLVHSIMSNEIKMYPKFKKDEYYLLNNCSNLLKYDKLIQGQAKV